MVLTTIEMINSLRFSPYHRQKSRGGYGDIPPPQLFGDAPVDFFHIVNCSSRVLHHPHLPTIFSNKFLPLLHRAYDTSIMLQVHSTFICPYINALHETVSASDV